VSGPFPARSAIFKRLLTAAPFTSSCSRYLSCDTLKASTRSLRRAACPSEFACPNQNVTTPRPPSARAARGSPAAIAAGKAATSWRRVNVMAFPRFSRERLIFVLVIRIIMVNFRAPVAPFREGCHDATSGVVGGQIGYRSQSAGWVFGLEAQGDWADLK